MDHSDAISLVPVVYNVAQNLTPLILVSSHHIEDMRSEYTP